MEQNEVHIVEWPKQEALLQHSFPQPVQLEMMNTEKTPLFINMNMAIPEGKMVPFCIKLCEPICAESSYRVAINLLGQPFAEIVVKGITRLFNCRDNKDSNNVIKENSSDTPNSDAIK